MEVPVTRELYDDHPELHEEREEFSAAHASPITEETAAPSGPPISSEDFEHRVTRLMELMDADPKNRDRILAEIYVNIASAEMGLRGVFEAVQKQGISGLMKGAFRRGN